MHYISEWHLSVMGKRSSSNKTIGVGFIIMGLFIGLFVIVFFTNVDIPPLAFVKTKISSEGAEIEVGDISESNAVLLGGITTIALIISGAIIASKK